MLEIAIVDDDITICSRLLEFIEHFFGGTRYNCDEFSDGYEFINDYKRVRYDIIFLDVAMSHYDGVMTGRLIRELDYSEYSYIIYISSHTDNLLPLFEIHPFYFMKKPIAYDIFSSVMKKLMTYLENGNRRIPLIYNRSIYYFPLEDILYIESKGHKVLMYTLTGNYPYELYYKLDDIFDMLLEISNNFYRIHRSFIVNQQHISRINRSEIAVSGHLLPLGDRYKTAFLHRFYVK